MTGPSKRKGDAAEREVAGILTQLLGVRCLRKLGAGRAEDTGDIHGIEDCVVQVANWTDVIRAVREKPLEAEAQRGHAGATHAATWVRLRGGVWRVVLTPEQFACLYRQASA